MNYRHYNNGSTQASFTVAYQVAYSPDGLVMEMAVARCSPGDQFCRKTGRGIAEKHLLHGSTLKVLSFEYDDEVSLDENILNCVVASYNRDRGAYTGQQLRELRESARRAILYRAALQSDEQGEKLGV